MINFKLTICFCFFRYSIFCRFCGASITQFSVVFMIGMCLSVSLSIFEIPGQKNSNEDWFCIDCESLEFLFKEISNK